MEGADDILLVCKFLRSFAKLCFLLKILLEIVFACLTVEVQQIVKLFNVQLVVAP